MTSESLFTKCKSCGKSAPASAFKCPSCGKILKMPRLIHWIGIIIIALIIKGIINSPESPTIQKEEVVSPKTIKQQLVNEIELEYKGKKEGFGGSIMAADFHIKNNSLQDIKDIEIQCDHFAKSGTKIDSNNRTIYEIIKAKSSKSFLDFNMGFIHSQVKSSSCFIKDFSLVNV